MIDELVYHYTTFDAFLSIVESNSLWASDLEAMNDPAELWNARQLLQGVLAVHGTGSTALRSAMRQAVGIRHLPRSWEFAGTSHLAYERFAKGAADYLGGLSADSHWNSAVGHVFGVSFCKRRDLLSQWRAYGLNGSGVCIGFDRRELAEAFQPGVEVVDIDYDEKSQVQCVLNLLRPGLDRYVAEMKNLDPSFFTEPEAAEEPVGEVLITIAGWEVQKRSSQENEIIESCLNDILSRLSAISHTFKVKAFREEQEVRLVSKISGHASESVPIKLRARGNELLPYVEMKPRIGILPIERVIVGPASKSFAKHTH